MIITNGNQNLGHDFSHIELKHDHAKRPLWISENNLITLEAFSPLYKQATDFLIAIAEPVSRPTYIHEYRLTRETLYAAVSVGLTQEDIEQVLNRLAKNKIIPVKVTEFIKINTSSYGKAKIVLKDNRYYIEAIDSLTMNRLLKFDLISKSVQEAHRIN